MMLVPNDCRGAGARVARIVFACMLVALVVSEVDARPWSWLGVRIRDLSEQEMEEISARHCVREGFGVVVVEVLADTPAARAGLQNGDVVVAFGDRPVVETRLLQRLIAAAPTTEETRLTVLRPEGRRLVSVRLAPMPRPVAGDRVAAEFGFVVREPEAAEAAGQLSSQTAPSVAVVLPNSPAEKAGLQTGDVIFQVEERPVVTREAAREALADASPERPLRLAVRRGPSQLTLTLAPR
jgi:S1-C subfamily serine protease